MPFWFQTSLAPRDLATLTSSIMCGGSALLTKQTRLKSCACSGKRLRRCIYLISPPMGREALAFSSLPKFARISFAADTFIPFAFRSAARFSGQRRRRLPASRRAKNTSLASFVLSGLTTRATHDRATPRVVFSSVRRNSPESPVRAKAPVPPHR